MKPSEVALARFLRATSSEPEVDFELQQLSAHELGRFFVLSAFLLSALETISEQNWVQTRGEAGAQAGFTHSVLQTLSHELAPLQFLETEFRTLDVSLARVWLACAKRLVKHTVNQVKALRSNEYQLTITSAVLFMSTLTRDHERLSPNVRSLGLSLYRTFDAMDEILEIDYQRDVGMFASPTQSERLYEGAGIGVQTSYATILIAIDELAPLAGQTIIDLGSGYGRVGFIIGLLRPDVEFIGYEYVPHRIDVSNAVAKKAGLEKSVKFFTQDLAASDFRIPEADIYYMYDPFSQETYEKVFAQLKAMGRERSITVATKGRASGWIAESLKGEDWDQPEMHDIGTLQLFRS